MDRDLSEATGGSAELLGTRRGRRLAATQPGPASAFLKPLAESECTARDSCRLQCCASESNQIKRLNSRPEPCFTLFNLGVTGLEEVWLRSQHAWKPTECCPVFVHKHRAVH